MPVQPRRVGVGVGAAAAATDRAHGAATPGADAEASLLVAQYPSGCDSGALYTGFPGHSDHGGANVAPSAK